MASIRDEGNVSICLSGLDILVDVHTGPTRAVIYRHPNLGRILALNDEVQHVEAWAPLYHEPLVHLPMSFVEQPGKVLILGGGSFFAASEVLKYGGVARVLMIDHDRKLLDTVSAFYEHARIARTDARLELRYSDAFEVLPDIRETFDLVINDSIDLLSKPSENTFAAMVNVLDSDGVCADVVYRHIFEQQKTQQTIQILRSQYRAVFSLIFAPEYPGILHLLTIWGTTNHLRQTLKRSMNIEQHSWTSNPKSNPCVYFDPRYLSYYLHVPGYVRDQLGDAMVT